MAVIETYPVTDRESWLALRKRDITASDIGAICGFDPYRSPLRVWAEKTGAIEPEPENDAMRRGRWMEPAALHALREERPAWEARKATVYLRDPEMRIGCTPDVVVRDPERPGLGNAQIKVVARRKFNKAWRGVDSDDEDVPAAITAPLHYQLQTITESKLLDASWAVIPALVVGEFTADLHIVPVDIHEAAWARIRDEVAYFWRCVETGVQPAVDPERDAETLAALFPAETIFERLDLSGDNELPALLAERNDLMAGIKAADERKKAIETIVKDRIREHAGAFLPGWSMSWTTTPESTFTVTRKASRTLRITKKAA